MNNTEKLVLVDRIYAGLPAIACQQKCAFFCGPIAVSWLEAKRLNGRQRIKTHPIMTRIETGQSFGVGRRIETDDCFKCPLLGEDGRCRAYDIRPGICRLWGLTEKMKCPHGCVPERWVTQQEAFEFLAAIFRVV